jgi:hypothetical protein
MTVLASTAGVTITSQTCVLIIGQEPQDLTDALFVAGFVREQPEIILNNIVSVQSKQGGLAGAFKKFDTTVTKGVSEEEIPEELANEQSSILQKLATIQGERDLDIDDTRGYFTALADLMESSAYKLFDEQDEQHDQLIIDAVGRVVRPGISATSMTGELLAFPFSVYRWLELKYWLPYSLLVFPLLLGGCIIASPFVFFGELRRSPEHGEEGE